ncbi:MAG TPA: glycosyltransferase N-terminal domain-containing protein, partial [Puia sp.]|nr:glycosyltransferase N-terminal domain-containing protein [Puia sp.]
MYTIFLRLYYFATWIVSLWNPKAKSWIQGRKNLLQKIESISIDSNDKVVWMHCASLGEFEQGRPVIERIKADNPACKIILTFFSPSGYEIRKNYAGANHVFYLPMDSRANARRIVNAFQPSLVLWVKYDYWYFYLRELQKRNIPALLLSAVFRPDQVFFKWYGKMYRKMLVSFQQLFVQTTPSKELLAKIGITNNVMVSGDTRFDRVISIAEQAESIPVIEQFIGNNKTIVAGSTWEEDEEELDHYANTHPDIKFIIAPHEIDEDHLRDIETLYHNRIRFSELEKQYRKGEVPEISKQSSFNRSSTFPNVLIIDNIGMLSQLYKYATIAYIGGGFGEDGVHNVLEAAVYGRPVIFGPVIDKYQEAMDLVDSGGGIIIDSALDAESVFDRLFVKEEEYRYCCEASRNYVYSKKGATEMIMRYIQEKRL